MAIAKTAHAERRTLVPSARVWRISAITRSSRYYWVRVLLENPLVVASFAFLAVTAILGVFAPLVAPFEANFVNPAERLQDPSSDHWFGTDDLGRDVFSQTIFGARVSLLVGVTVMVGAISLGALIGLSAGYYRRLDTVLMRIMDGLEAFPSILLAIAIMATFGPATKNVIFALSVVFAPNIARLVRSTTLMNREQPYVESARTDRACRLPHPVALYLFELHLPADRPGHVRRGVRHLGRGIAFVPWGGRSAGDSDLGRNGE